VTGDAAHHFRRKLEAGPRDVTRVSGIGNQQMTRIKICGLRETEHALTAAEAGVDFLGFVFANSRRQVTPARAKEIISVVRGSGLRIPRFVGVFVNEKPATVNAVVRECGLDYAQLSGDEPWSYDRDIDVPAIKVIRVRDQQSLSKELSEAVAELRRDPRYLVLLDSHVPGRFGGTGQTFDWAMAAKFSAQMPILLAGGLHAGNVATAVNEANPWGVDVSSGVETAGQKDPAKIRAFVEAVRSVESWKK